ncbi:MAG: hypothetical protein ACOYJ2_06110 [Rickettsiales bacterium]
MENGKSEQFVNRSPNGRVIAAVEFDAQTKTAFFTVAEGDVDRAKALLQSIGQTLVTQSIVLVTRGEDTREALFSKLGVQGQVLEPAQPEKQGLLQFLKKEGWKLRGGSSIVGQSLTLFAAANSISKTKLPEFYAGKHKPSFDPSTGAFAVLNLTANFVNWIFGGQKEEDKAGLKKFDDVIVDEINRYQPGTAQQISAEDVRKVSYMSEKERAEHEKERSPLGVLQKNSVRLGEVGLRTAGSIFLMFNYKAIFPSVRALFKGKGFVFHGDQGSMWKPLFEGDLAKTFKTVRTEDNNTFLVGCGMVTGKIMGLFAETYDPNNPPKTYLGELRQKVFWTVSSWTEMFAQSFAAYDRFANKRLVLGGKPYVDYSGGVGNIILTVPPYPTRLVLPYGEKVLDVNEIQARLLDELPKLPAEKIPEVVARVCARMDEHMGEKSPGFAKLYAQVMEKLENFHHISAKAVPAGAPQPKIHGDTATVSPAVDGLISKAL